jgi:hypothetical protein
LTKYIDSMNFIPVSFRKSVNPTSGFFYPPMNSWNIRQLFLNKINEEFLCNNVAHMLTNPAFVHKHIDPKRSKAVCEKIAKSFADRQKRVREYAADELQEFKLPYYEELTTTSNVLRLRDANRNFIFGVAVGILKSPDAVLENFYELDPEMGEFNRADYSYGASSYSDGTWHPEHLFTESDHNRKYKHHQDLWVHIDPSPEKTGLGHMYNKPYYAHKGSIPHWQYSMNTRPYERDNGQSLREGGLSDRRTQIPRGYNKKDIDRTMARLDDKYRLRNFV